MMIGPRLLALFLTTAALSAGTQAQLAPSVATPLAGISRADLLQRDLGLVGHQVVQARVSFAPGAYAPGHRHPGEEIAYVLAGTLEYRLDGGPAVTLQAGETLFIPDGTVHSARNIGSVEAVELATYFVRRGEPLLTPAE